jgi:hypothetical protein
VVAALAVAATIRRGSGRQPPSLRSPGCTGECCSRKDHKAPRTPDGQPAEGFWTNSTYVPLERPQGVTKEFYTPAEAEEAIKKAADREAEQTEPGTTADVHYDFTQFGLTAASPRSPATCVRR